MNSLSTSRRQWLRRAALTGAGLAALPSLSLSARPAAAPANFREYLPQLEWERQLSGRMPLKARMLANENPYGPSPKCVEAIAASASAGNRYQHEAAQQLKGMIAAFEGVPEDYIMITPGSSEVLEKMALVHFQEGGNVVAADPTYMSLIKVVIGMGGSWNKVKVTDDWAHDLAGMRSAINADTKLVYVCNPNNPTGTLTDSDALAAFCREVADETPVFVDEAYLEFLPDHRAKTMVPLIREGKDVIVARTFSKIHGMAGLRVGYAVARPETLEKVGRISRGNMGLCKTSLEGAMASMEDETFQETSRQQTAAFREQVYAGLEGMGMEYLPSYASFVLFPIPLGGEVFLEQMFDRGIGVRSFSIHGDDYCRVSVGKPEEVDLFLTALRQVLA
ncbi:histidinol-phosphate aminotransferase [Lewinella marina]|uniref:Histidinol phosphate aminotransferase n=1 Tax=Neolewinella marina TaxID=438751 RepID=A0A2G0CE36_9BACT|nr:histidinol-phosphate transaminase [Neolewinella marina]NJB87460.1 histidinol-phosphate aminotransferase [Neolewinella marina]PHK98232.1 histidinol phosphate aminotransferase [Neolewinella marina]